MKYIKITKRFIDDNVFYQGDASEYEQITEEQYQEITNRDDDEDFSIVEGVVSIFPKPPLSDAAQWYSYKQLAQVKLNKTDLVALRCVKAGIEFPQDWKDYTAALRYIVGSETGDYTAILPIKPDYPEGS